MSNFMFSSFFMDLILGLLVVEILLLSLKDVRFALSFLPFFCAGAALILALRVALVGGAWPFFAAALFAALVAHLGEIYRRVRNKNKRIPH